MGAAFQNPVPVNYFWAIVFIVLGAVFDFFDGMVARALGVSSPIGKELDSLADVVTFGVAPSAMLFKNEMKMKKSTTYIPQGVCSQLIDVVVEDGKVSSVQFIGGCHGNTQGVAALIRGMEIHEAIARLEGIDCRGKGTSCPDQLAQALKRIAD